VISDVSPTYGETIDRSILSSHGALRQLPAVWTTEPPPKRIRSPITKPKLPAARICLHPRCLVS